MVRASSFALCRLYAWPLRTAMREFFWVYCFSFLIIVQPARKYTLWIRRSLPSFFRRFIVDLHIYEPKENPIKLNVWSPNRGDLSHSRARKWASNLPETLALALASVKVWLPLENVLPINLPILLKFFMVNKSENEDVFYISGAKFS